MLCSSCGADVGDTIRLCDKCEAKEAERRKEMGFGEPPPDRFRRGTGEPETQNPEQASVATETETPEEELPEPSIGQILTQPLPLTLGGLILFMFFALVVILLKPGGLGVMIVGGFLSFVGFILGTISGIVLLVFAFQQSVFWGLAYLFIPFAALVFVIMHWQICRKAFLASLLGAILALSGVGLLVFGFHQKAPKEQFKFKSSTQSIPQFSPRRTEIPDIPHI